MRPVDDLSEEILAVKDALRSRCNILVRIDGNEHKRDVWRRG